MSQKIYIFLLNFSLLLLKTTCHKSSLPISPNISLWPGEKLYAKCPWSNITLAATAENICRITRRTLNRQDRAKYYISLRISPHEISRRVISPPIILSPKKSSQCWIFVSRNFCRADILQLAYRLANIFHRRIFDHLNSRRECKNLQHIQILHILDEIGKMRYFLS